jgi:hypothetical protein
VVKMKTGFVVRAFFSCFVIWLLMVCGCTENKTTKPTEPDEPDQPVLTFMQEYFPLDQGDSWTWEVAQSHWILEEFVDGDSSLGEPYSDNNHNGVYDNGDTYEDLNDNGRYDGPNDPWTPPIPFVDRNEDGEYDAPNGIWDEGELLLDLDGDGVFSWPCTLTLQATVINSFSQEDIKVVEGQFIGIYSNGEPGGVWAELDLYSNDSLGLRWHGHIDWEDTRDFLAELCDPIVIADTCPDSGEMVLSTDCVWDDAWLGSTFEGFEDVSVPAGEFKDCLKFQFYAEAWEWSMERYDGISYRWYAKGVGLVKSTGPWVAESRVLKSASVGGVNYP